MITVTQVVRSPSSVVISFVLAAGVWWLYRRRHSRTVSHRTRHRRHLRRRIVTAGLITAAMWVAFAVLKSSYELGDMLTSPETADTTESFPGLPLLDGLLSTTGVTYLALALVEQPWRRQRRRVEASTGEVGAANQRVPDDA